MNKDKGRKTLSICAMPDEETLRIWKDHLADEHQDSTEYVVVLKNDIVERLHVKPK